MAAEQTGMLVGMLCGGIIGTLIGSLIGAIILRAAVKWVKKLDIPFGSAYVTMLIAGFINYFLGFVVGAVVGMAAHGNESALIVMQLGLLPLGFLIQAAIISARHAMSFGSAVLVELAMMLITLIIGVIIGVFVLVIFLAFGLIGRH
jgi:hypothetical protein